MKVRSLLGDISKCSISRIDERLVWIEIIISRAKNKAFVITPINLLSYLGNPVSVKEWYFANKTRINRIAKILKTIEAKGKTTKRDVKQDFAGLKEVGYNINSKNIKNTRLDKSRVSYLKQREKYFENNSVINDSFEPENQAIKQINEIIKDEYCDYSKLIQIWKVIIATENKNHHNGSGWIDINNSVIWITSQLLES